MNTISQSFSDLIYKNVFFQKILPKIFPQLVLPVVHLVTPSFLHIQTSYYYYTITAIILLIVIYLLRKFLIIKSFLNEDSVILEITPPAVLEKTAYTTEQLFKAIHDLGHRRSFWDKLLGKKVRTSFEIVSTLHEGIRYLVRTVPQEERNIKNNLISYLPQIKVKKVKDYLPDDFNFKIVEFKLSRHFAYPLKKQDNLEEHDPVAYITGMMTKLSPNELIAYQIVISPVEVKETNKILLMIFNNKDTLKHLDRFIVPAYLRLISFIVMSVCKIIYFVGSEIASIITEVVHHPTPAYKMQYYQELQALKKPERIPNTFETQTVRSVQDKISKPLFETSIRLLVEVKDKNQQQQRIRGFISAFAPFAVPQYQSLRSKNGISNIPFNKFGLKIRALTFKKRLLSLTGNTSSNYLSSSEISDLYHFPFMRVTQTEDIVKSYSKDLPAPMALKLNQDLDVTFGVNSYGGSETMIGLTEEERKEHVYIIGRTNSGKSTIISHMVKDDIQKGRGVAVVDPHGDLAEELLSCVPDKRINELMYFNPFDLKHPMCINLIELNQGLDEDELELEKELVCENVITIFRRVFSDDEKQNAHRIEYILRNTIYTAFNIPDSTIFTVYKLLSNPDYQKEIVSKLEDENLKEFWKSEFGRAGNWQIVKMVGGVTAKVGRFLFSPIAKRILGNPKSTINFDDLLNSGKILICNLSEGRLGDDTSHLLGTTIITKIHQSAMRRQRLPVGKRKSFYLFVDEFQNFATSSFTKMLSGGRKFGLRVAIAQQSTAQQEDKNVVNVIFANTGTFICFRTASPLDEELMLAQFNPYVKQGELMYLHKHHFYIMLSAADEPQPPFSGGTLPFKVKTDQKKIDKLIEASRKNYTILYQKPKSFSATPKVEEAEEVKEEKDNQNKDSELKRKLYKKPENKPLKDEKYLP